MELTIQPREQYCDQVFRFYEPQNFNAKIRLPKGFAPFFQLSKSMTVRTSDPKVSAFIKDETGEVFLTLMTERAPRRNDCFVYLY